jgi:hypothetical protein
MPIRIRIMGVVIFDRQILTLNPERTIAFMEEN